MIWRSIYSSAVYPCCIIWRTWDSWTTRTGFVWKASCRPLLELHGRGEEPIKFRHKATRCNEDPRSNLRSLERYAADLHDEKKDRIS